MLASIDRLDTSAGVLLIMLKAILVFAFRMLTRLCGRLIFVFGIYPSSTFGGTGTLLSMSSRFADRRDGTLRQLELSLRRSHGTSETPYEP